MKLKIILIAVLFSLHMMHSGCSQANQPAESIADVIEVTTSGPPEAYTFHVTIQSPDTGCEQYADWWEVLTPGGDLIYRRILLHSHTTEQPFTRTGGQVKIEEDVTVVVRAHMNNGGYGGKAMKGSAKDGFLPIELSADFAGQVETMEPLPDDCVF